MPTANVNSAVFQTIGISWEDLSFSVSGNEPRDLLWLREFLEPWFTNSERSGGVRVQLERDANSYQQLLQEFARADTESRKLFSLDTRVLEARTWVKGDTLYAFDQGLECFYLVSGQGVRVLAPEDNLRPRFALVRVLRELVWQKTGHRSLALHASALEYRGRALLIMGPKEAGKTTLLTYLLSLAGTHLITNDWVMVTGDSQGRSLRIRGMPTIVSIREGTQELIHDLRQRLHSPHSFLMCPEHEACPKSHRCVCDGKIYLGPSVFASRMGGSAVATAPPGPLFFPARGTSGGLVRLPPEEVEKRLRECFYGRPEARPASTIWGSPVGPQKTEWTDQLKHLPAWEVCTPRAAFARQSFGRELFAVFSEGNVLPQ